MQKTQTKKLLFKGLKEESKKLKIKLSSILNNSFTNDCLDDDHSQTQVNC